MHRRHFLSLGIAAAGATALGRFAAARTDEPVAQRRCIVLYMEGGASQLDTIDPKPGSANAGGVKAIASAVGGLALAEFLPRLAGQANRLAVLRGVVGSEGSHPRARHLMHTGYAPGGAAAQPALGSIVAAERPHAALPGYVSIGGPGWGAGFLGADAAPFAVRNASKPVRNLRRARRIDGERFDRRSALRAAFDGQFLADRPSPVAAGQRAVTERALAMMASADSQAFDLSGEDAQTREAYGDSDFGRGCLMARRLVEAGVPFVEVTQRGWDTHQDNAARVARLAPELDRGMAALLEDLAARGLLESTLIVWMGDFGRTPWVNARGGRDHYPAVSPVMLAGAGLRTGQVLGATGREGVGVVDGAVTVPDLFRTIALAIGLNPDRTRFSPGGRPLSTVDGGHPIAGLLGD